MDDTLGAWTISNEDRKVPTYPEPLDIPRNLAMAILEAAWSKNGYQTRLLEVGGQVSYTDMFVLLTGRSDRHVLAIADAIQAALKEKGIVPLGVEGRQAGTWVLLDFGSVVVHVFEKTTRDYYDLEKLWAEAQPIPVVEPAWVQEFARVEKGYDGG